MRDLNVFDVKFVEVFTKKKNKFRTNSFVSRQQTQLLYILEIQFS